MQRQVCTIISMINLKQALLLTAFFSGSVTAIGQSVLSARMQELLRNEQLSQPDPLQSGLMVNAFERIYFPSDSGKLLFPSGRGKVAVSLLPVSLTMHQNTQLPYDWNLGAMVPAKGMQYHASAGVQLKWRNGLRLQLAPELVMAENKNFETYSQELNPQIWRDYFLHYYNVTDIPKRMEGRSYHRFHPGQSALSYVKGFFTYSLSTMNKWWGPGYRNALVMSSNASGFPHLSAATNKPVSTRWGKLEGELMAGLLQSSGQLPPRRFTAFNGAFVYTEKNNETRYITGLTLNWQPKWVKGLYLGFAKASYLYPSDFSSPLDVLPVQGFLGRKITRAEKNGTKASLGSLLLRFVLPEEHAEVYLEYGRKDGALMPWNILSSKPYRNGYVGGLRKLLPLGQKGAFIQVGAEITHMQAPDSSLIMKPESWYTHNHVRQGYTHLGKSLGAGIGPGSNAQTIVINWIKGQKRVGLQLERVKQNADFYYAAFTYLGDFRRHWIKLAGTLNADWDFRHLSIHGSVGMIRSLNHQWIVIEADPNNFFSAGNDYLNIASQVSVRYRF